MGILETALGLLDKLKVHDVVAIAEENKAHAGAMDLVRRQRINTQMRMNNTSQATMHINGTMGVGTIAPRNTMNITSAPMPPSSISLNQDNTEVFRVGPNNVTEFKDSVGNVYLKISPEGFGDGRDVIDIGDAADRFATWVMLMCSPEKQQDEVYKARMAGYDDGYKKGLDAGRAETGE